MTENDDNTDGVKTPVPPSTRTVQPQISAYGDIATIEVGNEDEMQIFRVHKGVVSFYSGYFRAALGGSWTKSSRGVIKLDTENPLVFERFVLWLYTSKITDNTLVSGQKIIIDLWLFADRREIPLLMNDMINALHIDIADRWTVPTDCLHNVYENTPEGSALRRMLVWSMSRTMGATSFSSHAERWPREALLDMLKLFLSDRPAKILSQDQYKGVDVSYLPRSRRRRLLHGQAEKVMGRLERKHGLRTSRRGTDNRDRITGGVAIRSKLMSHSSRTLSVGVSST